MKSLKIHLIVAVLSIIFLEGCAYKVLFWEHNMWQDMRGIITMVEPADLTVYRKLLPDQFAMPDEPMVGVYVFDFLDTEPWPVTFTKVLKPYREATILLRCTYKDQVGWYSLTMPVTDEAADIGGRRLGFPKYVADNIVLAQADSGWVGTVDHQGKKPISLEFTPRPRAEMGKLAPLKDEFMQGKGSAAEIKGPFILLRPPGKGPKVNVILCSPPSRVAIETGMVRIDLAEPWNTLVPRGTVSVGLFERLTLGATQKDVK